MKFINKYGQVSLQCEQNIIIADFSGNVNASLVSAFANSLLTQVAQFANKPWGYISNSQTLLAATPQAEQQLTLLTSAMVHKGCIASAYIFDSSIVINQMQRILDNAGLNMDIRPCLFNSLAQAKAFVNKTMTEKAMQLLCMQKSQA
ncbi:MULTISPECIES: hypothetical protein [Pseudoalteromonas]|uniref:STAS domain-containing protein n=1 Tax=Pseudoalteromonas haloplanktis TaxID=228 RepID=A0ABU1B8P5_PSEHA|nr:MULTISPECIES: hypothetical protein [Pseudoalteromonas]MCF6142790.1 hypothetical protein [Pseudoalteromonas mariniglutinosa NCIMB 1770]MDQ9090831.1 hypothetical protein [Pseudoalteromonas haloplanktis]TMN72365.1 hypothetical protein CWB85_07160 [Pseudoalteromonas sp. S1727]